MDMEKLVSLCKRRGIIFPSSEIYGGINGFWDYGPLGVELKRNIKEAWWQDNITRHDDTFTPEGAPSSFQMTGLDCSIIMNPKVWVASGHVGGFSDPMSTCRQCKRLFRSDQVWDQIREADWFNSLDGVSVDTASLLQWANKKGKKLAPGLALVRNPTVTLSWIAEEIEKRGDLEVDVKTLVQYLATEQLNKTGLITPCPNCGGELTEPRQFNLMFDTNVGAVADEASKAYLRPETAQGIFANFKNVLDTSRVKLPFGIAQVGKSFRNEITPRNFIFRSREFEQMEIEFFCHPDESEAWYSYWRKTRFEWYVRHGLASDRLRLRDHDPDELAFYSKATADIEYEFPFGVSELEGIAHRSDYDLKQHQQHSGKDLSYFDEESKSRFLPHVIEPSAGADRATLAFLCEAFVEDQMGGESRTVLRFHPRLAPVKAAVFPLVKKDGMPEKAESLYRELKRRYHVFYDEKGAIGRRYRRQDEAGTPFCITIDGQTAEDDTVTFRDRDSGHQWRVPAAGAARALQDLIEGTAAVPRG